ncbi:hypothetical protein D3C72_2467930 [compost metagenome]
MRRVFCPVRLMMTSLRTLELGMTILWLLAFDNWVVNRSSFCTVPEAPPTSITSPTR